MGARVAVAAGMTAWHPRDTPMPAMVNYAGTLWSSGGRQHGRSDYDLDRPIDRVCRRAGSRTGVLTTVGPRLTTPAATGTMVPLGGEHGRDQVCSADGGVGWLRLGLVAWREHHLRGLRAGLYVNVPDTVVGST